MTDDDRPVPVMIRPAMPVDPKAMELPSRKTFKAGPDECDTGVALTKAIEATIAEGLPDPVGNERLAEDEIRQLDTERKKRMGRPPGSKNKPKTTIRSYAIGPQQGVKRPKRDRHEPGAPGSYGQQAGRLKRDRHAPGGPSILRILAGQFGDGALNRSQLVALYDIMRRLERMPKGARKRIIAALVRVYP